MNFDLSNRRHTIRTPRGQIISICSSVTAPNKFDRFLIDSPVVQARSFFDPFVWSTLFSGWSFFQWKISRKKWFNWYFLRSRQEWKETNFTPHLLAAPERSVAWWVIPNHSRDVFLLGLGTYRSSGGLREEWKEHLFQKNEKKGRENCERKSERSD